MDDIRRMSTSDVDFEVFANFGCSHINGKCRWMHSWDETINLGIPCRAEYKISYEGKTFISNFFDTGCDCVLCNIYDLIEAGVHSLKIVDRTADYRIISSFTKGYKMCIDNVRAGVDNIIAKDIVLEKIPTMVGLCEEKRCRLKETNRTKAFI